MSTVTGKYRRGKVVLDQPVDWEEGERVIVTPREETMGLNEADWPDTPEAREELLKQWEALEPLVFTEEDETRIAAARKAVKDYTLKKMREKKGLDA